jgi:hypothetical protein
VSAHVSLSDRNPALRSAIAPRVFNRSRVVRVRRKCTAKEGRKRTDRTLRRVTPTKDMPTLFKDSKNSGVTDPGRLQANV